MNFKSWINENAGSPIFTVWSNDGTIVVWINQKKYTYNVDPMYHENLKRMAKFKPWAALNQIKELIKSNKASLFDGL